MHLRRPDRITVEVWVLGTLMLVSFAVSIAGWI